MSTGFSPRRIRVVGLTSAMLAGLIVATPLVTSSPAAGLRPVVAAAASPELVNRAVAAGINYPSTISWDVCVADWNNDGKQDMHISTHFGLSGAL